jgi:hypothetical protein
VSSLVKEWFIVIEPIHGSARDSWSVDFVRRSSNPPILILRLKQIGGRSRG